MVSADRPTPGSGIRVRAARGTLINGAFVLGVNTMQLLRGFIVAAFLTTSDYGVWGIVVVILATLGFLKAVGIAEKYIQQDEDDQELAFRRAMTLDLMLAGAVFVVGLGAVPALAALYGTPDVILPALVALLVLPLQSLQAPLWIFYRNMDFLRQRKLQALDPIGAFVVTIVLVSLGVGYWSLILGVLAGAALAAAAALRACPYPLRPSFDRETMRGYVSFSWPLLFTALTVIVMGQGLVIVGNAELGLAGVGIITLTAVISQYSDRADQVVTQTIYPTICAVKDRRDLLFEAFVKSNRLALMWGAPFGFGLALFASDLVAFGIGEEWRPGVGLMQAVGVTVAIHQIGFNWDAFYRAQGQTKPTAVAAVIAAVAFLAIGLPLLKIGGLGGLALAFLLMEGVNLAVRVFYLARLFKGFRLLHHAVRSLAPSVPAVAVVLGLRAVLGPEESLLAAIAMLALYIGVTAGATAVLERPLVREVVGYLRGRGGGVDASAPAA